MRLCSTSYVCCVIYGENTRVPIWSVPHENVLTHLQQITMVIITSVENYLGGKICINLTQDVSGHFGALSIYQPSVSLPFFNYLSFVCVCVCLSASVGHTRRKKCYNSFLFKAQYML